MTNTTYDPRLLEQWAIDPSSTQDIGRLLETYLHQYDCAFFSKKQRSHFAAFVKGLLSPLDRKSIEPIALHLLDEKSVQPMQQFFTCAPLDEPAILDICQQLLAAQLNHEGAMLSVDDTSFIKKRNTFYWSKTTILRQAGQTGKLSGWGIPFLCR